MKNNIFSLVLWMILIFSIKVFAQNKQANTYKLRLGFNTGFGTQGSFPFNSTDYLYNVQFYKFQINYLAMHRSKWNFEINLEPSYYLAEHQLLNKYYVKPEDGDDYLEKRDYKIMKGK